MISRRRPIALFVLALTAGLDLQPAIAIEPGGAACKRELQVAQKKMQELLALVGSVQSAPVQQKCQGYSRHIELANEIRESFARCELPDARARAVRNADEVIDATQAAYEKWCPPRPGMIRVRMIAVKRITRDQLPRPLAAVHRCTIGPMYSINERFDLGRLVILGCPGNPSATADDEKARNARADLLQKEQAAVYITRDMDGNDPHRLNFPILGADGTETTTDLLFAGRASPGEKLDEISAYWETAKDGACRVHAVWRVTDGKAALVLWQEAPTCSNKPEFKTILDRR